MAEQQQDSLSTLKQNLIEYVQLQLASQIIDLELDPEHYEAAYQKTIGTYRQLHVLGQRRKYLSVTSRSKQCKTSFS
jgi:hypothetical protein